MVRERLLLLELVLMVLVLLVLLLLGLLRRVVLMVAVAVLVAEGEGATRSPARRREPGVFHVVQCYATTAVRCERVLASVMMQPFIHMLAEVALQRRRAGDDEGYAEELATHGQPGRALALLDQRERGPADEITVRLTPRDVAPAGREDPQRITENNRTQEFYNSSNRTRVPKK